MTQLEFDAQMRAIKEAQCIAEKLLNDEITEYDIKEKELWVRVEDLKGEIARLALQRKKAGLKLNQMRGEFSAKKAQLKVEHPKSRMEDEEPVIELSKTDNSEGDNSESEEWVDLGLPSGTLWAKCNVGANAPEKAGNYYTFDEAVELGAPTMEQLEELKENCEWEWDDEKKGMTFTGKNGNSIFLPAAGYRDGASFGNVGTGGYYWASTPNASDAFYAYRLYFDASSVDVNDGYYGRRDSARPVRLVRGSQN